MTDRHEFTAYAFAGELDLNRLSSHLGITRKLRWEEPLLINPVTMAPVSVEPPSDNHQPMAYLYFFGSVVFLDCPTDTVRTFFREMAKINDLFAEFPPLKYQDTYSLRIDESGALAITSDYAVMAHYFPAFMDIIAFVIAKSVALERIEEQVDKVLDEMEEMIGLLDQGKLNIPDKKFAKLAAKILTFKHSSLASIMILDKPDITWENSDADRLYLTMASLFELDLRYQQIKHKAEALMDATEVFSTLTHATRASRLEMIIIILIAIEIVIYLFELLMG
jgi:required for meiotic nuclear division protein 1